MSAWISSLTMNYLKYLSLRRQERNGNNKKKWRTKFYWFFAICNIQSIIWYLVKDGLQVWFWIYYFEVSPVYFICLSISVIPTVLSSSFPRLLRKMLGKSTNNFFNASAKHNFLPDTSTEIGDFEICIWKVVLR